MRSASRRDLTRGSLVQRPCRLSLVCLGWELDCVLQAGNVRSENSEIPPEKGLTLCPRGCDHLKRLRGVNRPRSEASRRRPFEVLLPQGKSPMKRFLALSMILGVTSFGSIGCGGPQDRRTREGRCSRRRQAA